MTGTVTAALLDAAQAEFLTHHVSILVGSCSADREPSIVRAYGCRVAPDRRSLKVFLSVAQSRVLLDDLRAGAAVAVVFSRPTTHETLQLKGTHARLVPLDDGDRDLMRAYGRSFQEEIAVIGHRDRFANAVMAAVEEEAVGMEFTPNAAFEQTPGPSAGQPLNHHHGARSHES